MTYKIELHKNVEKFLDKQTDKFVLLFQSKVEILSSDPYTSKLDIKQLQGSEKGNYRLRVGKYRFKYTIIKNEIIIYFYDADSRGDVYK